VPDVIAKSGQDAVNTGPTLRRLVIVVADREPIGQPLKNGMSPCSTL
jgi:hypothetical protein